MDIRKRLRFFVFFLPLTLILFGICNSHWLPTAVNLVLGLAAFVAGLALGSQFLFPVHGRSARWQAFRCLFAWFGADTPPASLAINRNPPSYVVQDGKDEQRVDGSPFAQFLPGVVLVDTCSAVQMFDGLTATRVVGTGIEPSDANTPDGTRLAESVYALKRFERIRGVVDLRWQSRNDECVRVMTRDGINLEIELQVDFQIERDAARNHPNFPYTYSDHGVYRAVYGEGVLDKPAAKYDWTQSVVTLAADNLRHMVSQFTLDQLFAPDQEGDMFSAIEHQVGERLQRLIFAQGAQLIGVTLGFVTVPPEVIIQRVENWRVSWESRKAIIEGQAESEARKREELARAQAQMEMIQSIVQSLQGLPPQPAHDVITLRLIEALEKMSREPLTRDRLPPQVQTTISALLPGANSQKPG